MRQVEIDKDIPLPKARTARGTYNFVLRMQPGDSVQLDTLGRNAILARGRALGWSMRSEKVQDNTHRIWRVK